MTRSSASAAGFLPLRASCVLAGFLPSEHPRSVAWIASERRNPRMSDTEQIGSRMSLFRPLSGSGRHDRSWKYGTSVRFEQGRVNTELSAANDSKAAFPQQPCHRGDE